MPIISAKKIVLALVAENENRTLEAGSAFLGNSLTTRGYEHLIIDMMFPDAQEKLQSHLASGQVAFVYGLAGVGSQFKIGETNLWAATRVPFLSLWYDHPSYNYRQHIVDSSYVIQAYHVQDHFDARAKHLNIGASSIAKLPLRFNVADPATVHPFRYRAPIILFAKTGINPQTLTVEWKEYPLKLQDVLWALVEMAKKDRNLDLADATAKLFLDNGQTLENLGLYMGAVAAVDAYIRAWRSDRLARALLRHPTHFVGRGWDYLRDEAGSGVEFHGPLPVYEFFLRSTHYRVLANANPLWRDGIHERCLQAISVDGISLTDRTQKSDEILDGLPNYVGFEWVDDLEDVISHALGLAQNPDADFHLASERRIKEKGLDIVDDYMSAIEKAVAQISVKGDL